MFFEAPIKPLGNKEHFSCTPVSFTCQFFRMVKLDQWGIFSLSVVKLLFIKNYKRISSIMNICKKEVTGSLDVLYIQGYISRRLVSHVYLSQMIYTLLVTATM